MPRTKKGREEEANFPRPFSENNHKRNEAVSIIGKVDTIAKVKVELFRLGNKKGRRDRIWRVEVEGEDWAVDASETARRMRSDEGERQRRCYACSRYASH
jgi:hypothetical protein